MVTSTLQAGVTKGVQRSPRRIRIEIWVDFALDQREREQDLEGHLFLGFSLRSHMGNLVTSSLGTLSQADAAGGA